MSMILDAPNSMSCGVNPTKLNVNTFASFDTLREYLPSASVTVPVVVFLTSTLAPTKGAPSCPETVPEIVL